MPNDHQGVLQEFRIAIRQLVPLTPKEIIEEAHRIADDLEGNENVTAHQIRQALIYIGKKEFPYRKAYQELCASDEETRMQTIVLNRLDAAIKEKMEPVAKYGVHILDYVQSSLFETQLNGEERLQVDAAIISAHDELNKQCDDRATQRKANYEELVTRWSATEEKIQSLIEILRGMADRDEKWKSEILGKVEVFEEGWSVTESDPTEEEVQKEIEYWAGVFQENPDDEILE